MNLIESLEDERMKEIADRDSEWVKVNEGFPPADVRILLGSLRASLTREAAKDAEIARLREAVEWACMEMNKGNRSVRDWHLTVDETRRRAKEGR